MMQHKASSFARVLKRHAWRFALVTALLPAVAASIACEDKGLGRTCDVLAPTNPSQGIYTVQAADCPSKLCVKPALQAGVSKDLDTGPYCTVLCDSDNDCNGQTRDSNNPNDRRCKKGFACAMAFGKGELVNPDAGGPQSLCCQKICLCKDFFTQAYGPAVPNECKPDSGMSCR